MLNLFNKTQLLIISFLLVFILPLFVFAQDSEAPSISNNLQKAGEAAQYDTDRSGLADLADLVGNIIGAFFAVLGIIFLGYMIYGGWIRMTARGEEQRVTEANAVIKNAIIGIIILVGAYAITYFVLTALEGFNANL